MGFFIGWKYFDEKDRYSHAANQERERLKREQRSKEDKQRKKDQIKKKKEREKKERLQKEWNEEAAQYHEEQFGFDCHPYKSNYINEDAEAYKEQIAKQYGGSGQSSTPGVPNLNRGNGRGGPQMKKLDSNSPFDPKNKRPAGMNLPGLDNPEANKDSGSVFTKNGGDSNQSGQRKKGTQGPCPFKLNRPI